MPPGMEPLLEGAGGGCGGCNVGGSGSDGLNKQCMSIPSVYASATAG